MNFTGGKYKILDKILPLFPEHNDVFVDLFGGGMNVAINVENCDKVIYNDYDENIVGIMSTCHMYPIEILLHGVLYYIDKYELSKTNVEGYNQMRKDFNEGNYGRYFRDMMLYTLTCYSFNYQTRFNQKGEFNMPFGKNRSSFNDSIKNRMIAFCRKLHGMKDNIVISHGTYYSIIFEILKDIKYEDKEVFFYCDPPYLNSVATYNERGGWTEEHEEELLECLDMIDKAGMKFALSNNLKYDNPALSGWRKKYNTHYINADYSNCNYQKKDRSEDCEVLITNY